MDPLDRDAVLANLSLEQSTPAYHVICELACIYSPEELLAVKRAYQARYHRCLEEDLKSRISGDLGEFLAALVGVYRYVGAEIDPRLATSEANDLHNAIHDLNYREITRIVATRSKAQLIATLNCYKDEYGASITEHLVNDPANHYLAAVSIAVQCIKDPEMYYEKLQQDALRDHGINKDAHIWVIVKRAEKDFKAFLGKED